MKSLPALLLFGAAALTALWQSSRATVLWDVAYVLEVAYRITLGDMPYRDFVVPQPPLTFLLQAAILRFDSGYVWHRIYCALVAGGTALLTYRIIWLQLDGRLNAAAPLYVLLLALPIVFLNGYAILPLPFYDPDCTFFVLLSLHAVLVARRRGNVVLHFGAGMLLVIPLLAKQNIGVAALIVVHAFLLLCAVFADGGERRRYAWCLAGSIAGLGIAAISLHAWVGLPYLYEWTVSYAAARRWPSGTLMLSPYLHAGTWATAAAAFAGYATVRRRPGSSAWILGGFAILAMPFVAAAPAVLRWGLAARSFYLWGLAAIVGSLVAIVDLSRDPGRFERALPLMAMAIAHAAFASQGIDDSAYSVWPLLMIALAPLVAKTVGIVALERLHVATACVVAASAVATWVGYRHVARQERLGFVDLAGPVEVAATTPLGGLSTPGTYLPDFERLVRRCRELIPSTDGVLAFPGEDPFFFATGRRPRLPIVLFDDTAMPYGRDRLVRMLDDSRIEWVVLKDRLQLRNPPWKSLDEFVTVDLPLRYDVVESLPRYRILRRRPDASGRSPSTSAIGGGGHTSSLPAGKHQ